MVARIQESWDAIRSSWWFVPTIMAASAVLLSFVTTTLDSRMDDVFEEGFGLYGGGAEGSRSVLETVAGSMITVAGVTFSIAIVVMTLASAQFGPRLLRTFMRDLGNQITLGTFVATFIFSVLVLRTVRGENGANDDFIPALSVTVAILLTLASLAVFIYFIHHSARSIQVGQIVAAVGRDLDKAIDNLFPSQIGHDARGELPAEATSGPSASVASEASCYVQQISARELMEAAGKSDVIIELTVNPGSYVVRGAPLALVRPADKFDERLEGRLRAAVSFGDQRTEQQDLGFAFDQLQQICLRALSPALNDPLTATMCIDRMAAGLVRLADTKLPAAHRADDEGRVRVIVRPPTVRAMLETAFAEVRRSARSNVPASARLLDAMAAVGARASRSEDLEAIREACRLVVDEASDQLSAGDIDVLRERQRAALAAINSVERTPPPIEA